MSSEIAALEMVVTCVAVAGLVVTGIVAAEVLVAFEFWRLAVPSTLSHQANAKSSLHFSLPEKGFSRIDFSFDSFAQTITIAYSYGRNLQKEPTNVRKATSEDMIASLRHDSKIAGGKFTSFPAEFGIALS
jgi:hypothetical protein